LRIQAKQHAMRLFVAIFWRTTTALYFAFNAINLHFSAPGALPRQPRASRFLRPGDAPS